MAAQDEPQPWRTRSVEDFLKTVYLLQREGHPVTTNQLARALRIAPASATATDMIKRLASMVEADDVSPPPIQEPLVEYQRYHGVRLSAAGEQVALSVIRRRRLIELLLCRMFGYRWDEVDQEAEMLEHAISAQLEGRIAAVLGYPDFDPHGDPIPTDTGVVPDETLVPLAALQPGQTAVIRRINNQEPEVLRSLACLGLVLEQVVMLRERNDANDTITLELCSQRVEIISTRVAQMIAVKIFPDDEIDPICTDTNGALYVDDEVFACVDQKMLRS